MLIRAVVVALLAVGTLSCTGGSHRSSPDAAIPSIKYRHIANTALYAGADYEGMFLYVFSDITGAESCMALCTADPDCTFFYYNARGNLVLEPLKTDYRDCAFFRGELWAAKSNNSDTYVKMVDGVDAWEF